MNLLRMNKQQSIHPPGSNSAQRIWPMLSLVFGLPLAAVIAGLATLVIALRSGGTDAIPAEVRRTAQIQVEEFFSADQVAREREMHAELQVDAETGALLLQVAGAIPIEDSRLNLQLIHPIHAARDQQLVLIRSTSGYVGRMLPDNAYAWNLRLTDMQGDWRLHGRLFAGTRRATLRAR